MIRPLRARHRRAFAVLAVLLPLGLAAAVAVRPVEPTEPAAELAGLEPFPEPTGGLARVFVRGFGTFAGLPLEADLGRDDDGAVLLELRPTGPLLAPDLLLYWLPEGTDSDDLNAGRLLGRVSERSRRFLLPADSGTLVLFDLARGERVAKQAVPALNAGTEGAGGS